MEDENKPMDEFEWEQFLKKNDEMVDKFSALMEKYIDDPNCDEIIAREMGWNHLLDNEEVDGIERPWLDEFNRFWIGSTEFYQFFSCVCFNFHTHKI